MEYFSEYFSEDVNEAILSTLPPILWFISGFYISRQRYCKSDVEPTFCWMNVDLDEEHRLETKILKNEIEKSKEMYMRVCTENENLLNKLKQSVSAPEEAAILGDAISPPEEEAILGDAISPRVEAKKEELRLSPEGAEEGCGVLRYKNNEDTLSYHGIGHLEKDYSWWRPLKTRCIIEYKNKDRKIKFPFWETHNISDFCTNCEYCTELNKNRRCKFYYECKGHKINE